MGKARIQLSWELVQDFLQLPKGWTLETAYVETHPRAIVEPTKTLHLIVSGENIESKEPPVDLHASWKQRTIDDETGRWVQGHWELFR